MSRFAGNPFFVFGARPVREQRIRAHIVLQHRLGRPIATIMHDPYMRRYAVDSLAWKAFMSPETVRKLGADACESIRGSIGSIAAYRSEGRNLSDPTL